MLFNALEIAWLAAGAASLAAAACLLLGGTRSGRLAAVLEALERPLGPPSPASLALGAVLPAACALFKVAQFREFHLMPDSAVQANVAWNLAHGNGLLSSIHADTSYLGVHFAFTLQLLAPLLLVWESIHVLILAQALAVGSCGLAAWLIARRAGLPAAARWAVAALLVGNSLFHGLVVSVLDSSVFTAPLLLWCVYAWQSGRRAAALSLAALALTAREQVPFAFLGLGLALALGGSGERRGLGFSVAAGSLLLFLAEMAVVRASRPGDIRIFDYWELYRHLGGDPEGLVRSAATRPWEYLIALVHPPEKLGTVARVLGSFAFLPVFAGPGLLPAAAMWLPQQLAHATSLYHKIEGGQYGSYILAPLTVAAVLGLQRLWRRADGRRRELLCAWTFGLAAGGFFRSASFAPPPRAFPGGWKDGVPAAERLIPKDAKLWCDEYLTPNFAMRRHLRVLPHGAGDPAFLTRLFAPDRVLLSTHWFRRADPLLLKRVFGFLSAEGYEQILVHGDLVLLAPSRAARPLPLRLVELPKS